MAVYFPPVQVMVTIRRALAQIADSAVVLTFEDWEILAVPDWAAEISL